MSSYNPPSQDCNGGYRTTEQTTLDSADLERQGSPSPEGPHCRDDDAPECTGPAVGVGLPCFECYCRRQEDRQ